MRCNVCGGADFVACDYRMGDVVAPALGCLRCKAIALDESLARTGEERESVKLAIAMRTAVGDLPQSETRLSVSPPAEADAKKT